MDASKGDVADIIDRLVVRKINPKEIEPRLRLDIGEKHVLHSKGPDFWKGLRSVRITWRIALVNFFDAWRCDGDSNAAFTEDKITERAVAHDIVVRPADADATAGTLEDAVGDSNVFTRFRLVELFLHAADDDAVITVCEVAIADDDITARA